MFNESINGNLSNEALVSDIAESAGIEARGVRASWSTARWLNTYEATWKTFDAGIISEEHFIPTFGSACFDVFKSKPIADFKMEIYPDGSGTWANVRKSFNPRFIDMLERRCPAVFSG